MSTSEQTAHLSPLLKQSSSVTATRGEGAYLFDEHNNRYLDFTSGIGVTSTGHCHPKVVAAAQNQAAKLIHGQYAIVRHSPMLRLAEKLSTYLPDPINHIFFSNAGTEAIETALRLARQATGKPNMIAFQGGFHGRTMGSLSMTSSSVGLRAGIQPTMGGVFFAPFPATFRYGWSEEQATQFCLRELDHLLATQTAPKETAAILVEPIQGESGYIPANTVFMKGLRERCDQHHFLLILDEVQAGNGRTGRYWGYEHFGIEPDVVVTAKGLASGFPLSCVASSKAIMAKGWPGSQGGTYGGNAVSCAAALATLDVIEEEGLVENAAERGEQLYQGLIKLQEAFPEMGDVRGKGLMLGVEMVDRDGHPDGKRAEMLLKACEERDLLLIRCGPYGKPVVRWLPPLIADAQQIDWALEVFADALSSSQNKNP